MRQIFRPLPLALFLAILVFAPVSGAATIYYAAFDIPDFVPDQDRWEYHYYVSGITFDVGYGFTVWFDQSVFQYLELPSPPNSDWDVIVLQPDEALPADGLFDAIALASGSSVNQPFVVSFVLANGTPGSQPFDINQFDSEGNLIEILESGYTIPIPEPGAGWLVIAGMSLLLLRRSTRSETRARG